MAGNVNKVSQGGGSGGGSAGQLAQLQALFDKIQRDQTKNSEITANGQSKVHIAESHPNP